jgi:hypothetical protein
LVTNYVQYDVERNVVCGDPRPELRAYCHPDSFPGTSPKLYRNLGEGTFADVTVQAKLVNADGKSLAVALADLDGDSWTDIFIANDTRNRLLQPQGRTFDASYTSGPGSARTAGRGGMSARPPPMPMGGEHRPVREPLDAELNRHRNDGRGVHR